jgi:hypothetical protein
MLKGPEKKIKKEMFKYLAIKKSKLLVGATFVS